MDEYHKPKSMNYYDPQHLADFPKIGEGNAKLAVNFSIITGLCSSRER
jgi:hypothetical protein